MSEGRRTEVVAAIAAAAQGVAGAALLDVHADGVHNRAVLTIAGSPGGVAEAAFRVAEAAVHAIDLRTHEGVHPRIGALDVLPFVPLRDTPMAACVDLAHQVGCRIAESLGIPVYFYGQAALRPDRLLLADIRRGGYEALCEAIRTDAARRPDVGPAVMGPAGATAVGARKVLVAFNVHLQTADLQVAQAIAQAVRQSSGGLPGVQALGFRTSRPDVVQVSMNVTDPEVTPLQVVVERVRQEAGARGVELAESELIGLVPLDAALGAASAALGLHRLAPEHILELAAGERPVDSERAGSHNLSEKGQVAPWESSAS